MFDESTNNSTDVVRARGQNPVASVRSIHEGKQLFYLAARDISEVLKELSIAWLHLELDCRKGSS